MKQQQEDELLKVFQAIFDSEERQFILDLAHRVAARQVSSRPLLRVILGGRQKTVTVFNPAGRPS